MKSTCHSLPLCISYLYYYEWVNQWQARASGPRFESLAKVHGPRRGLLRSLRRVPCKRTIRSHFSDSARRQFGSRQHRRRLWSMEPPRFWTISCDRLRLRELETHLILSQRLGFVSVATVAPLLRSIDEIAKMLYRMRQRVLANAEAAETALRASRTTQNHRLPLHRRLLLPDPRLLIPVPCFLITYITQPLRPTSPTYCSVGGGIGSGGAGTDGGFAGITTVVLLSAIFP